jgi:hypothetical protein
MMQEIVDDRKFASLILSDCNFYINDHQEKGILMKNLLMFFALCAVSQSYAMYKPSSYAPHKSSNVRLIKGLVLPAIVTSARRNSQLDLPVRKNLSTHSLASTNGDSPYECSVKSVSPKK